MHRSRSGKRHVGKRINMKKNRNKVTAVLITLLMVALLAGCRGTTITAGPKGATFEFQKLSKEEPEETTAQFFFDDGLLTVELESGTANVKICRTTGTADEELPEFYTELETLFEAEGLKNGDELEVSGVRGHVVMRVWGDGKNGKVKIAAKK